MDLIGQVIDEIVIEAVAERLGMGCTISPVHALLGIYPHTIR